MEYIHISAIPYILQLFFSEILFLQSSPKRNHFFIRLLIIIFTISAVTLFSNPKDYNDIVTQFFGFFALIIGSIAIMFLLYRDSIITTVSSAVSGIAAQHAANKLYLLSLVLPGWYKFFNKNELLCMGYEILICLILITFFYILFGRKVRVNQQNMAIPTLCIITVLICIGINRLIPPIESTTIDGMWVASNLYAIICCIFALWIHYYIYKYETEVTSLTISNALLAESEKQYQQWVISSKALKHQAHDIKHMLNRIESLANKNNIDIPDMQKLKSTVENMTPIIKTGNEVLDVLLKNYHTLCADKTIRLQIVSYSDVLKDFDGMSLYFIMANAMDNAIESVEKLFDPQLRIIDISIRKFGESAIINIWNYYEGEIIFENNVPITQAVEQGHGYGITGMKYMIEKLGGNLNISTDNNIFNLDIIIPV